MYCAPTKSASGVACVASEEKRTHAGGVSHVKESDACRRHAFVLEQEDTTCCAPTKTGGHIGPRRHLPETGRDACATFSVG